MIKHNLSVESAAQCCISAGNNEPKPASVLDMSEMLDFSPTLFCEKNTSIQIQIIKAWLFLKGS